MIDVLLRRNRCINFQICKHSGTAQKRKIINQNNQQINEQRLNHNQHEYKRLTWQQ